MSNPEQYKTWQSGMYVMLSELSDHELALVENSLRDSRYFKGAHYFKASKKLENKIGVFDIFAGYWFSLSSSAIRLTKQQALHIVNCSASI